MDKPTRGGASGTRSPLSIRCLTVSDTFRGPRHCHTPSLPSNHVRLLHTSDWHLGRSFHGAGLLDEQVTVLDAIVEIVRSRPAGTVTLCPTGPLTNVALAMIKAPDIVPRLSEIVLMGGAIGLGNTTPSAEFNVYVDPHAARVVFESGAGLTMIGLEATHQALCTPARLEAIRALGTEVGRIVTGWLEFYNRYDRRLADGEPGGPLHDPCVVAYLLRPELFAGRRCRVDIETTGELTVGRTVVDWRGRLGLPPNATVIDRLVDADGFFALLTERLGRL